VSAADVFVVESSSSSPHAAKPSSPNSPSDPAATAMERDVNLM
jgi:hypothetical protein